MLRLENKKVKFGWVSLSILIFTCCLYGDVGNAYEFLSKIISAADRISMAYSSVTSLKSMDDTCIVRLPSTELKKIQNCVKKLVSQDSIILQYTLVKQQHGNTPSNKIDIMFKFESCDGKFALSQERSIIPGIINLTPVFDKSLYVKIAEDSIYGIKNSKLSFIGSNKSTNHFSESKLKDEFEKDLTDSQAQVSNKVVVEPNPVVIEPNPVVIESNPVVIESNQVVIESNQVLVGNTRNRDNTVEHNSIGQGNIFPPPEDSFDDTDYRLSVSGEMLYTNYAENNGLRNDVWEQQESDHK